VGTGKLVAEGDAIGGIGVLIGTVFEAVAASVLDRAV
jgi:hypothetical protein